MSIEKEIHEIIEKNLPAQTGTVLKKCLEEADYNECLVNEMKGKIIDLQAEKERLNKMISHENVLLELEKTNLQKSLEIEKRERELSIALLTVQKDEAVKRSEDIYKLVSLVFRSPIFTKSISGTQPIYVPSANGCQGYASTQNYTKTESEQTL